MLDLAIVGAGAAGTFVANEIARRRPDWSVVLFERTDRIGGRLRSVRVPDAPHPIELGGMRYLTSHRFVDRAAADLGLATHAFDIGRGPDRCFLRGVTSTGAGDPRSGAGYDLAADEAGHSAADLLVAAFERIVPGAAAMDLGAWDRSRATLQFRDRPLRDWAIGDALADVLSASAHRFVNDAFGYDSGLRGQNAADAIPYLLGAGDPSAVARTPDEGMQALPIGLAAAFEANGGQILIRHELLALDAGAGRHRLRFANGASVDARRVVLALTAPALRRLAVESAVLREPRAREVLSSVDAWPAIKLYAWYERPWWRDDGINGMRTTTDLPPRKIFYFDEPGTKGPAILLAAYTDGRDTEPWQALADGSPPGSAAPAPMIEALAGQLQAIHPKAGPIPPPLGSAVMHWGSDPNETGWHYWSAGANSSDVIAAAIQPHAELELFLCGEAFSRLQAWVEGAFESAAAVVDRMTHVG
ncbi:MAG: hypothetical protein QOJ75_699 [Chloroflexota bacterium]|nr:hypothetical protein [Chloroflexota bacterium]